MATWTEIDDTRLEPGKPIRSVDGLALRDNPIAIAEGAPGAPRNQEASMADNSVSTRTIQGQAVTAAKLAVTGNEMAWVLGRTAGAGLGAVGAYAFLKYNVSGGMVAGGTYGGNLSYAPLGSAVPGTWRAMGTAPQGEGTVCLRIA